MRPVYTRCCRSAFQARIAAGSRSYKWNLAPHQFIQPTVFPDFQLTTCMANPREFGYVARMNPFPVLLLLFLLVIGAGCIYEFAFARPEFQAAWEKIEEQEGMGRYVDTVNNPGLAQVYGYVFILRGNP